MGQATVIPRLSWEQAPWWQIMPPLSREQVRRRTFVCWQDDHPRIGVIVAEHGYGATLVELWRAFPNISGVRVLEWDLAVEPEDLDSMECAIATRPGAIICAAYRLYSPDGSWAWAHRAHLSEGHYDEWGGSMDIGGMAYLTYPCLGLTYLPNQLFEAGADRIAASAYPFTDEVIRAVARDAGIDAWLQPGAFPKHLHWR